MTSPLPLYLRREMPTDPPTLASSAYRQRDVVAYRDPECKRPAGRWPWWHTQSRPTRRNRYVMLNCYRWRAVWLPEASIGKESR